MSRQHYQVSEIFHSVQGEGVMAGRMATFIRLQGCNVHCEWCDTKYTWAKGGTRMQLFDIARKVKYPHVVITGGEPLLYDLDNLIAALYVYTEDKFLVPKIQVETSGGCPFKGKTLPDWITCSPKPNLGFKIHPDLIRHVNEFKFVVDDTLTEEVVVALETVIRSRIPSVIKSRDRCEPFTIWRGSVFQEARSQTKIVLMPEGCPPRQEMIERSLEWISRHPEWRISDRMQYRFQVQ